MIITLKNKETLICEDFVFRCSIGRNGITKNKKEGDKKTPSEESSVLEIFTIERIKIENQIQN